MKISLKNIKYCFGFSYNDIWNSLVWPLIILGLIIKDKMSFPWLENTSSLMIV